MKYDLAIAYRIYPGVSKVPPVYPDDKLKLSELCLKSFVDALDGLSYKVFAIMDNCPDIYADLFNKYFDEDKVKIIRVPETGNGGTFKMQMELLLEQEYSDNIYFAEDDYFYLPGTMSEMLGFLNSSQSPDFLTPYEHPDYYESVFHKYNFSIAEYNNHSYRTGSTTTMTFMTKKETLEKTRGIFYTYAKKNYDNSLWLSLTKTRVFSPVYHFNLIRQYSEYSKFLVKLLYFGWRQLILGKKYSLLAPSPSFATHMDNIHLAPVISWNEEFAKNIEKINFLNL